MNCSNTKFVITKGSDNSFIFVIKQSESTLPMEIVDGDIFKATLTEKSTNNISPSVDNKVLTVVDAASGKVSLEIPSEDTESLVSEKGGKADRYYLIPTYNLKIDCETTNNGSFIAKVNEVYVE